MKILAIESSCDETAASVVETDGVNVKILSNVIASQIDLHKQFGGVFPEKASRAHAEKIIPVVKEALNGIDPDLVAVTIGPGLIGSLLIGVNFAKTYAFVKNKPIIGINHWLGHIYSNWANRDSLQTTDDRRKTTADGPQSTAEYSGPKSVDRSQLPSFPALILIVSGGHTGLVLMKSHNDIQPLGETLDDAAGEAFDKVAKILGLDYPGGPAISKAAEKGDRQAFQFPRSMLDRKDYNFSFSGLKTAVLNESKKHQKISAQKRADFASSFQQAVIDILVGKTIKAAYEFKPKSICLCGGVSANKELREQMKKAVTMLPWKASYHVPELILSTDNAAMIGIATAYHLDQKTTWDKINADSNLKL